MKHQLPRNNIAKTWRSGIHSNLNVFHMVMQDHSSTAHLMFFDSVTIMRVKFSCRIGCYVIKMFLSFFF